MPKPSAICLENPNPPSPGEDPQKKK